MEKRALVLALALTLPLALYGIPYAYAITTQSTYVVVQEQEIPFQTGVDFTVKCLSSSDFTQHWSHFLEQDGRVLLVEMLHDNSGVSTGDNPNGWLIKISDPNINPHIFDTVTIVCQSPIVLPAGIGVPEFSSLYVAIALGAAVYFMLSRQYAGKRALKSNPP